MIDDEHKVVINHQLVHNAERTDRDLAIIMRVKQALARKRALNQ